MRQCAKAPPARRRSGHALPRQRERDPRKRRAAGVADHHRHVMQRGARDPVRHHFGNRTGRLELGLLELTKHNAVGVGNRDAVFLEVEKESLHVIH